MDPDDFNTGKTAYPSERTGPNTWENSSHPSLPDWEKWLCPLTRKEWFQQPGLTNSVATSVHIQGLELAHPNIYPTYDLRECVKGLILWYHSLSISMTQQDI